MELKSQAYAYNTTEKKIISTEIQLKPLKPNQVRVQIEACGICFSDIDALEGKYAAYGCPQQGLVAGHEGVGRVTECGSNVTKLKVGDRVGLGPYKGSCMCCDFCLTNKTNLCGNKVMEFMGGETGCFAEYVHADQHYAIPIPDSLSPTHAAPLLCAGTTVFAPYVVHNIRPGDKVAVVGIGGLGHLALQFGAKMGCIMYAISSGASKKDAATSFGAKHYVQTNELNKIVNTLDYVLLTTSGNNVPWNELLMALKSGGKLIVMGASTTPIPVHPGLLILGQKSICGSAAGSAAISRQMIEFAAIHSIHPQIEVMKFDDINAGVEHVKAGKARFRVVLERPSSKNVM